ncbi:MAG: cell division protein FtsZ [Candidatus Colwellbacteria bacterium]|nr:cell division protein FtsZ [Candidatus Colwellbacteria bacterium]
MKKKVKRIKSKKKVIKTKKVVAKKPAAKKRTAKKLKRKGRGPARIRINVNTTKGVQPVRMKVVGVGGGGGNVIDRMWEIVRGVEFIAINTDIQDLDKIGVRKSLHIGKVLTKGMGAGMNPELGKMAAEENRAEIMDALKDADLIFLASCFGGGTGSGATHVVADIARELGALTIAVVTKPFAFEGSQRMKIAEEGLARLKDKVDALLVIPNDRIFGIIDSDTPMLKAFEKVDEILKSSVHGITEAISTAGIVNVDFADLRAIVAGAGPAVIGVGVASGKDRAAKATNDAVNSPLLETSIAGAKGIIFCVAANRDLKMSEVDEVAKIITQNLDPGAKIIFGAYNDRKLRPGQLKVIVIAAGFNGIPMAERGALGLFEPKEVKTEAEEEKSKAKKEESADTWEIPAFLRKKNKK